MQCSGNESQSVSFLLVLEATWKVAQYSHYANSTNINLHFGLQNISSHTLYVVLLMSMLQWACLQSISRVEYWASSMHIFPEKSDVTTNYTKISWLTLQSSTHLVNMTMAWTLYSHTILQKSSIVSLSGPVWSFYIGNLEYTCVKSNLVGNTLWCNVCSRLITISLQ